MTQPVDCSVTLVWAAALDGLVKPKGESVWSFTSHLRPDARTFDGMRGISEIRAPMAISSVSPRIGMIALAS